MSTADNTGLALPNPTDILIDIQSIVWAIANTPHHNPRQYLQYHEDVGAWTNTQEVIVGIDADLA